MVLDFWESPIRLVRSKRGKMRTCWCLQEISPSRYRILSMWSWSSRRESPMTRKPFLQTCTGSLDWGSLEPRSAHSLAVRGASLDVAGIPVHGSGESRFSDRCRPKPEMNRMHCDVDSGHIPL